VGVVYIPATRAARSLPSFRGSRASQYGARWGALKRKDCERRIQRLTRTCKQINRHTETARRRGEASDQWTSEVSQHYDTSHWSDVGQEAVQDSLLSSSTTHKHTHAVTHTPLTLDTITHEQILSATTATGHALSIATSDAMMSGQITVVFISRLNAI